MMTVTGNRAAPDRSGEKPATTCKSTTRKKNSPPNAAYTTKVTMLAAVNCGLRKISGGIMGYALRRSLTTKATTPISPTSNAATVVDDQPPPAPISA